MEMRRNQKEPLASLNSIRSIRNTTKFRMETVGYSDGVSDYSVLPG
jgi:hypothetical protein